ncbi:MAG: inorganic phosphate transporter [Burkholderiaceae bacterium]
MTGANVLGLSTTSVWLLIVSAVVGGYMAMNIGANDVANNMGPAVSSGAMTMGWAILIAALFGEALGAVVAGAMWWARSRAASIPPESTTPRFLLG